jgi:subtilisin family serine protease
LPPAKRQALAVRLSTITEVPTELQSLAPDVVTLRAVLQHFFTYTDADGNYYAKWAGSARDFDNHDNLSAAYKQNAVREIKLDRNHHYMYAIVPESLFAPAGQAGDPHMFREMVVRFNPTDQAAAPFRLATVHTARSRRNNSGPFHDFVFFFAETGVGLPVGYDTLNKLSADLRTLVRDYHAAADKQTFVSHAITPGAVPLLHLNAEFSAPATLPSFVIDSGTELVRSVLCPIDKLEDLAAVPQVDRISAVVEHFPTNDRARAMVQYDALDRVIPATKRGGAGVLVGVIDTGIDGSHPAFGDRIVAVWDQHTPITGMPAIHTGSSPAARHTTEPLRSKYQDFSFGVEMVGAETANSKDPGGHGTHTSGTCAGQQVTDASGAVLMPAGLAPNAKIAVVRAIGRDINGSNVILAIRYIFQKADELGLPCVINMSFGSQQNSHDGADAQSQALFHLVRKADDSGYRPGRILVASAGNERSDRMHVKRTLGVNTAAAPSGAFTSIDLALSSVPANRRDNRAIVSAWIKNPTGTCRTRFPLAAMAFRKANPLAATSAVVLGSNTSSDFPGWNLRVGIFTQLSDPRTGDFNVQFVFQTIDNHALTPDTWTLFLYNGHTAPLEAHAWSVIGSSTFPGVTAADNSYKVSTPASGPGVVSVAACASRLQSFDSGPLNDITYFSNPGPLRVPGIPLATLYNNKIGFETKALDVTAPGQWLQSARSSQHVIPPSESYEIVNARSSLLQGTSMASPVVTGLVANLLAEVGTLTLQDVLNRLQRASHIPAASTHQPPSGSAYSDDWGWGLVRAPDLHI